jgi:hypothetical protein
MRPDRLTSSEYLELGSLPHVVDCRKVRLYRRRTGGAAGVLRRLVLFASRHRAIALGNHVFLPHRCEGDVAVLAHELTHCGQYQKWGPVRYFSRGIVAQLRDLLYRKMRVGSSPYWYHAEPIKPFDAYGMEQQGQIVEDCFRGHAAGRVLSPYQPGGSG